ncbi:cation channel family protein [Stylonychia lemnae]|uniref:Cation channel family protein n=1 Tax=Stylonychia lemnae TaxID=5949 RepID=A0A077ZWJ0_STYLE|nr:cation channel family protein [Stylonychia lemnae]|eukprot:CDW72811.1 cation channel family protein [Stylonychia lemnae]
MKSMIQDPDSANKISKQAQTKMDKAKQETMSFLQDVIKEQRRRTQLLESFTQLNKKQKQKQPSMIQRVKQELKEQKSLKSHKSNRSNNNMNNPIISSSDIQNEMGRKKSVRFNEAEIQKVEEEQLLLFMNQPSLKGPNPFGQLDEIKRQNSMVQISNTQFDYERKSKLGPNPKVSQQLYTNSVLAGAVQPFSRAKSFAAILDAKRASQRQIESIHRELQYQTSEDPSVDATSSEEENLPYPYNALPEQNWFELKQQLRTVNLILQEADKDNSMNIDMRQRHSVPLHSKIFAARLLSISQNRILEEPEIDEESHNDSKSKRSVSNSRLLAQKVLSELGIIENGKIQSQDKKKPSKTQIIPEFNENEQALQKKKTIVDPYRCRPKVQSKWRRMRNAILIVVRLLKIHQQVLLYGTSEKLLDINRGIAKVRDIMIPDAQKQGDAYEKYLNYKGDMFIWRPESFVSKMWQDDNENIELFYLDTVIDFFFMFDIYVNFNTPITVKTDVYNNNRKDIINSYLKSWFLIDLFASLPMNLFQMYLIPQEYNLKGQDLIRIARLPRLYRLFRMARLTTFFISVFLCVHLVGCLWILAANLSETQSDTWIYRKGLQDADDYSVYLASIYWAFQTLLTVGYGDVSAQTNEEMIIAVIWMIVGSFFYTFTIGNLTSVISNQNTRQSQISDRVNIINQFCKETNLDRTLTNKLRNAVFYITKKNFVWADKIKIFEELPASVKSDIAKEMHRGIIKKIRFFDDKDNNFIGSIVPLLNPLKTFRHEVIYKKDHHPNSIFFITQGRVSFFIERKNIAFKDMIEGCYFGDIDIIFKRKRKYTVISAVDSDFLTFSKTIFEDIIQKDYPEIYEEMTIVAYEREKRIKDAKKKALKEYKAWKTKQIKQQEQSTARRQETDNEIQMNESELYNFIKHNNTELGHDESTNQLYSDDNGIISDRNALKKDLSQISESFEKENSQSQSQSSISQTNQQINNNMANNGQSNTIEKQKNQNSDQSFHQPKKGILKKIRLVIKHDENSDQNKIQQENFSLGYIHDQEPIENKLNHITSPVFKREKTKREDLPKSKRQSTIIIKAGKFVERNAFLTQKTQINRKIQRSMGSNLSIERRSSKFFGEGSNHNYNQNSSNNNNGGERRSYKMPSNLGTIFKASQQLQIKTLNEDDSQILDKVRNSRILQGRISKRNLDRMILSKYQEDDDDDDEVEQSKTSKSNKVNLVVDTSSDDSSSVDVKKATPSSYSSNTYNKTVSDSSVSPKGSKLNSNMNSPLKQMKKGGKRKKLKFNESIQSQSTFNRLGTNNNLSSSRLAVFKHSDSHRQNPSSMLKYGTPKLKHLHFPPNYRISEKLNIPHLLKNDLLDINRIEEEDHKEQKKIDKLTRNLQKDMDNISIKMQKQALSQRSLEQKIDTIGETMNTLIGQLVIIKENMMMEEESPMPLDYE